VEMTADTARLPPTSAEPPLNPNHPIHSKATPIAASGRLDGGNSYKHVCIYASFRSKALHPQLSYTDFCGKLDGGNSYIGACICLVFMHGMYMYVYMHV